jgi:perosamine synthetase
MEPWFDDKETEAVYNYMKEGGWLMEFDKTREFEKMICDYTGAKYCHIVNNGTISLSIALLALDVKKNDYVIVPNFTMIATPNSVNLIGANVILVDVEQETLCIDINIVDNLLKNDIDKKIKCVIHVSLNARCNDIIRLKNICDSYHVNLLEDSAQSLGSWYKDKHLGTFGHIGSFSFSAPKIISTGQGGALITNNSELSDKIWKIKNFGRKSGFNDIHDTFGINSKTTDIQSVIGIEQMKKLEYRVKRMKEIWNLYYSLLSNIPQIFMFKPNDPKWIPWFIDIYTDDPVNLQIYLKTQNIGTRIVYPPIHSQKCYLDISSESNYTVTEKYSYTGLWLPSSSKNTDEEIKQICNIINNYFIKLL